MGPTYINVLETRGGEGGYEQWGHITTYPKHVKAPTSFQGQCPTKNVKLF